MPWKIDRTRSSRPASSRAADCSTRTVSSTRSNSPSNCSPVWRSRPSFGHQLDRTLRPVGCAAFCWTSRRGTPRRTGQRADSIGACRSIDRSATRCSTSLQRVHRVRRSRGKLFAGVRSATCTRTVPCSYERLVVAVGVQALRAAQDGRQRLQRDADDVVVRLLRERAAAGLRVETPAVPASWRRSVRG